MEFENTVKKLLCEMPYINVLGTFDFELEKRQNVNDFLHYLKIILDGEEVVDKYKNKLQLNDNKEKLFFLKSLMSETVIQKWIDKQSLEDKAKIHKFINLLSYKYGAIRPRRYFT